MTGLEGRGFSIKLHPHISCAPFSGGSAKRWGLFRPPHFSVFLSAIRPHPATPNVRLHSPSPGWPRAVYEMKERKVPTPCLQGRDWSRQRDSNPPRRIGPTSSGGVCRRHFLWASAGKPPCCHYTMPAYHPVIARGLSAPWQSVLYLTANTPRRHIP